MNTITNIKKIKGSFLEPMASLALTAAIGHPTMLFFNEELNYRVFYETNRHFASVDYLGDSKWMERRVLDYWNNIGIPALDDRLADNDYIPDYSDADSYIDGKFMPPVENIQLAYDVIMDTMVDFSNRLETKAI